MSASPSPPPPRSESTVEALLCDGCGCPIGSRWDVLPAEEQAPAWKEHVYCYELDLFSNGSPPFQAYSATNPAARRFDLLRLAPHVTVHRPVSTPTQAAEEMQGDSSTDASVPLEQLHQQQRRAQAAVINPTSLRASDALAVSPALPSTAIIQAPPFVVCSTSTYSSEHSFFPGYAWCFCHCNNCGAFVGWGFAAEERLRAAQQLHPSTTGYDSEDALASTGMDDADRPTETHAHHEPAPDATGSTTTTTRRRSISPSNDAPLSTSSPSMHRADVPTVEEVAVDEEEEGEHDGERTGRENRARERMLVAEAEGPVITSSELATALVVRSSAREEHAAGGRVASLHGSPEQINTGVAPDFLGIIVTHCTGNPEYPIASLVSEVEQRPARKRRREFVHRLTRRLKALLVQMRNGLRAYQLLHDYSTMEQLLYTEPPSSGPALLPREHAVRTIRDMMAEVNADGVPIAMCTIVAAAQIMVERQTVDSTEDDAKEESDLNSSSSSS